mmetsp:Transcript_31232/g.85733  ORF Transcript_31232/g.85733 Transcript_31232/m.85733 type:complete len:291 (+) Transcript_31232:315-1187(+)
MPEGASTTSLPAIATVCPSSEQANQLPWNDKKATRAMPDIVHVTSQSSSQSSRVGDCDTRPSPSTLSQVPCADDRKATLEPRSPQKRRGIHSSQKEGWGAFVLTDPSSRADSHAPLRAAFKKIGLSITEISRSASVTSFQSITNSLTCFRMLHSNKLQSNAHNSDPAAATSIWFTNHCASNRCSSTDKSMPLANVNSPTNTFPPCMLENFLSWQKSQWYAALIRSRPSLFVVHCSLSWGKWYTWVSHTTFPYSLSAKALRPHKCMLYVHSKRTMGTESSRNSRAARMARR